MPICWLLRPTIPVATPRHRLLAIVTRSLHHWLAHQVPWMLVKGILLLIASHALVTDTPLELRLGEPFVIQVTSVRPHLPTVLLLPEVSMRVHERRCLEATTHVQLLIHRLHAFVVGKSVAHLHLVASKVARLVRRETLLPLNCRLERVLTRVISTLRGLIRRLILGQVALRVIECGGSCVLGCLYLHPACRDKFFVLL